MRAASVMRAGERQVVVAFWERTTRRQGDKRWFDQYLVDADRFTSPDPESAVFGGVSINRCKETVSTEPGLLGLTFAAMNEHFGFDASSGVPPPPMNGPGCILV